MDFDVVGGRKSLATLIILLTGVGLVAWKGDVPANMLTLMQVIFGGFVLGNVGSKALGAYQAKVEAAPSEPAGPPEPAPELAQLLEAQQVQAAAVDRLLQSSLLTNQALETIYKKAWPNG